MRVYPLHGRRVRTCDYLGFTGCPYRALVTVVYRSGSRVRVVGRACARHQAHFESIAQAVEMRLREWRSQERGRERG